MKIPDPREAIKHLSVFTDKHMPVLLTGAGIAGWISATVLAVRATPKAIRLLEEKKKDKNGELTVMETVEASWKCYIPTVITGVASTACLIGSNRVSGSRYAALAAAYSLSEASRIDFKNKALEVVGEKKVQAIHDAVAKEKIEKNPVKNAEIVQTGRGTTLCYDTLSGRYFYSDIEKLKRAENVINYKLRGEMYISLNTFYEEIGLEPNGIGDELGWSTNKGMFNLWFSSQLTGDGVPCLVMNYENPPEYDYYKTY